MTLLAMIGQWFGASRMISREEERELIRRFQEEGDEAARNALVEAHMGMVKNLATKRRRRCLYVEVDDLVQVGAMSLFRAVSSFDLSRNLRFLTYAYAGITRDMDAELIQSRPVRLPEDVFSAATTAARRDFAERARCVKSLNATTPGKKGRETEFIDFVFATNSSPAIIAAESESMRERLQLLESALRSLSRNERYVINGIRNGRSEQAMATESGVSRQLIDQVKDRAMSKLLAAVAAKSKRPTDWHQRMRERHAKAKV